MYSSRSVLELGHTHKLWNSSPIWLLLHNEHMLYTGRYVDDMDTNRQVSLSYWYHLYNALYYIWYTSSAYTVYMQSLIIFSLLILYLYITMSHLYIHCVKIEWPNIITTQLSWTHFDPLITIGLTLVISGTIKLNGLAMFWGVMCWC